MSRWSAPATELGTVVRAAVVLGGVAVFSLLLADAGPASATGSSTPGMVVKVTPDRGLVNGQAVTISGHGLPHTAGVTWFATECTASVRGRMNPATDTPHCNVTNAQAIRVAHNGSFSAKFRVHSGIIGDGYCGTPGHATCVIGVGTAKGQGTVVKITFAAPPRPTTTTTTTTSPSTTSTRR